MVSRAVTLVALMALLGVVAAAEVDTTPGLCYGKYKEEATFTMPLEAIRFQSLDHVFVVVDEEVDVPTLVLYSKDQPDGFKSLNAKIEEGELTIGAADSDRTQCVHMRLPSNFDIETLIADDNATVALAGPFTVPMLKLSVINGFFYEANSSDTSIMVDYLILNNTGVGAAVFSNQDDSVSDLEVFNNGNGDTIFAGQAGNGIIRHDGIGNVHMGKVTGNLEVFLTGQGDIAVVGSSTMKVDGSIKHPYQVLYEEVEECDLEAIMGNALFQPCKKVSSIDDEELVTFAG